MVDSGYKSLAPEYDALYRNKNYRREVTFITQLLHKNKARTILDVGCGTGTHLALLENEGFECTGIDLNKEMLEVAKKKVKGQLFQADMTQFSLNVTFDAIICLFAAFNHNKSFADAQKAIEQFKKHLNPNGILIIDLYNAKNSGQKIDQGRSFERHMKWEYDPITQTTWTSVHYKSLKCDVIADRFPLRHFTIPELQNVLTPESFSNVHFLDNFSQNPANLSTKNLIVFAQTHPK